MKKLAILFTMATMMLVMVACTQGQAPQEAAYVVLEDSFAAEEYGIGMRKGDYALNREIQKHLDAMIEDGTFAEISNNWFGEDISLPEADFVEEYEATEDDASLQNILDEGVLVMGLDDHFPPMGFRDENNEIVGFDIDLAKEVATRMGVELTLQPINWDAKEMELNRGNIDVIWNGMTITEPRMEEMYFSKPYIANEQVIVVAEGSDIVDRATLEGKTVGLQQGSSALDAVQADEATAAIIGSIVEYENNVNAYMDLKAGRIDALVGDEIVLRYMLETEE